MLWTRGPLFFYFSLCGLGALISAAHVADFVPSFLLLMLRTLRPLFCCSCCGLCALFFCCLCNRLCALFSSWETVTKFSVSQAAECGLLPSFLFFKLAILYTFFYFFHHLFFCSSCRISSSFLLFKTRTYTVHVVYPLLCCSSCEIVTMFSVVKIAALLIKFFTLFKLRFKSPCVLMFYLRTFRQFSTVLVAKDPPRFSFVQSCGLFTFLLLSSLWIL